LRRFLLAFAVLRATVGYQELSQNFVINPGNGDLHGGFRRR
jgi:hypothetical protein